MPADMQVADAIKQAVANITGNDDLDLGMISYLEMLRSTRPELFAQILAKAKGSINGLANATEENTNG